MKIENLPLDQIIPYAANPRNNDQTISSLAASIKQFGFQQPIVIDKNNVIIVGHTRLKAAQMLGLETAPCKRAENLTEAQAKAYRILDNKIPEKSTWDTDLLAIEIEDLDYDLSDFADISFPMHDEKIEPPSDFKESDEKIEVEYKCPGCGYEWSGKPK